MAKKKTADEHHKAGGLFIPAGLFIGFGVGFLIDNVPAGIFLGLGLGFLGFAIVTYKKWK